MSDQVVLDFLRCNPTLALQYICTCRDGCTTIDYTMISDDDQLFSARLTGPDCSFQCHLDDILAAKIQSGDVITRPIDALP